MDPYSHGILSPVQRLRPIYMLLSTGFASSLARSEEGKESLEVCQKQSPYLTGPCKPGTEFEILLQMEAEPGESQAETPLDELCFTPITLVAKKSTFSLLLQFSWCLAQGQVHGRCEANPCGLCWWRTVKWIRKHKDILGYKGANYWKTTVTPSLYSWRCWGLGEGNDLSKVNQKGDGRARVSIQVSTDCSSSDKSKWLASLLSYPESISNTVMNPQGPERHTA